MKKLLLAVTVAAFVLSIAATGYAGPSGTVDVLVTIDKTISIDVIGGPIDLGSIGVGETAFSSSAITVTNDGSGVDETITVAVIDPAGWTAGGPGPDQYKLSIQVSADGLGPTWLLPASVSETLAYGEAKKLWLKFESPTTTAVTSQQTIQVTINAE